MISQINAAILLRQAMQLDPGCLLPGEVINPTVSCAFERADYAAGSAYVASHRMVRTPSLQDVADHLNEPLFVPAKLDERALLHAQAVLRGRMLDHGYVHYPYAGRTQGTPINDDTVSEAVKLVTAAISLKQQKDAA